MIEVARKPSIAISQYSPAKHYSEIESRCFVVRHNDRDRKPGEVIVTYQSLVQIEQSRPSVAQALVAKGLTNSDLIADVVDFYPNGRDADPNDRTVVRKGIGTQVFQYVLNHCSERSVHGVFVYSREHCMQKFLLEKFEFDLLTEQRPTMYYKTVKPMASFPSSW
ncbi:MAG: hypothetical protein KDD42_10180 [Bdellovibrionales bacterium]|nr:hypothetical protein [Bdellovibrionales bacterium]